MSGKEASEQRMGLSGPGALSHVYIQHPPLRCDIPETQGLYYDDGNKLILSPTSGQVLSWKVGSFAHCDPPGSDSIDEGPVLLIRYSLDRKVIAIQRSHHEIQFRNKETGEKLTHRCRPESESILGFFWTDCPTCDIVLIKTSGLDLLSYEQEFRQLRLVEAKRLVVSWYAYTHESRMVLLASGMQCKIFSGYQFSSVEIVRLPKFEMKLTIAEANHKPVISAEDVNIVTIYGRIYCLQVDRIDMQLHMYRFYRDAVVHQGSLPIYSTRIAVNVVDNVLLVHQVDAKVVILYDIFLDSLSPISAPLPLLVKGATRGICSSSQANTRQVIDVEPNPLSAYEGIIFGNSWSFLVPDLICDVDHGLVWKIHLDLNAIAASSSEVPYVLEFLQRRRSEPMKTKQLCLALLRAIILERRPISVISRAINVVAASFSQDLKLQNASRRGIARASPDGPISGGQSIYNGREGTQRESIGGIPNQVKHAIPNTSNPSTCRDPDSEGIANLGQRKAISEESRVQCLPSDLHASSAGSGGISNTCDVNIDVDNRQSQSHSEIVHHDGNPLVSTAPEIQNSTVTTVAISPVEMYTFVFSLVEEAMTGDPAYLIAVIIEFLQSATHENLKVPQNIYLMTIRLLACSDRYTELGMFVANKILEPSKEIALRLIETGHRHTRKLGMDMLKELSLHQEYVQALTQSGHYLEALHYARKNKVVISRPSLYLEAALSRNNMEHLAALIRFFSEYVPGFSASSDYNRYCHIVSGIS